MKVAVDVCIGPRGITALAAAGHHVVARATSLEADHVWFARALEAGAEVVISQDADIAILTWDHRIEWLRPRRHERDVQVAARFVRWAAKHVAARSADAAREAR